VLSGFQAFKGRPFKSTYLRNVGSLAVQWTAAVAAFHGANDFIVRRSLIEEGIEPIRPPFWINTGKTSMDDLNVAGVFIGLSAAIFRRPFSSVTGWRRYTSFATFGWFSAQVAARPYFGKDFRAALDLSREQYAEKEEYLESRSERLRIGRDGLSMPDGIMVATDTRGTIATSMVLPPGTTNFRPGNAPYYAELQIVEIAVPIRDYTWQGTESETRDAIKAYEQERHKSAVDAEYMWLEIAKRENYMHAETDPNVKEAQATELRWLNTIHRQLYDQTTELDWVIANLKKYIRQLQAQKSGKPWLPRQELLSDPDKHSPEAATEMLRGLWENIKWMKNQRHQHVHPESDEQIDSKKDLKAIDDVLRDFEKKVEEANRRNPG
jgi:hypothetical protein